jgi:hypothetical protein
MISQNAANSLPQGVLAINEMERFYFPPDARMSDPLQECQHLFEDMKEKTDSLQENGAPDTGLDGISLAEEIVQMGEIYSNHNCDKVFEDAGAESHEEEVRGMLEETTRTLADEASQITGLPAQAQAALNGALNALSKGLSLSVSGLAAIGGILIDFLRNWATQSSDAGPATEQQPLRQG